MLSTRKHDCIANHMSMYFRAAALVLDATARDGKVKVRRPITTCLKYEKFISILTGFFLPPSAIVILVANISTVRIIVDTVRIIVG